jgi:hypothetical protein
MAEVRMARISIFSIADWNDPAVAGNIIIGDNGINEFAVGVAADGQLDIRAADGLHGKKWADLPTSHVTLQQLKPLLDGTYQRQLVAGSGVNINTSDPDHPVISLNLGTSQHNDFSGRSAADAHPISAVTGLNDTLQDIGNTATAAIPKTAVPAGTSGATTGKRTLLQAITIDSLDRDSATLSGWSTDVETTGAADIETKVTIPSADGDETNGHAGLMSADDKATLDNAVTDIAAETVARQNADSNLQFQIDTQQGKGGALTAYDFGTDTPTLEDLLEYACEDIWGNGGTFTYDSGTPAQSTYVISETTHACSEIFNNTWLRNTYNDQNHKWVLTNTPDTEPPVFLWTDVGQDVVADATDTYAGVAKLYNDLENSNTDGSVTQAAIGTAINDLSSGKQDKLAAGTAGNVLMYTGTAGSVGSLAVDNTAGGTVSSSSLITSGAVNTGLIARVNAFSEAGNDKAWITNSQGRSQIGASNTNKGVSAVDCDGESVKMSYSDKNVPGIREILINKDGIYAGIDTGLGDLLPPIATHADLEAYTKNDGTINKVSAVTLVEELPEIPDVNTLYLVEE